MSRLITNIQNLEDLKNLVIEVMLNNTDAVTKVSGDSVLNAIAFAQAKLMQKVLKEVAINESKLIPDLSFGEFLDEAANLAGVDSRLGATTSSAFATIIATPGTQYIAGVNGFSAETGVEFRLINDVTVNSNGIAYGKLRSLTAGEQANVSPNTILTVSPEPIGHISCNNEFAAIGGADEESDELFRQRIKSKPNLVSQQTKEFVLERIKEINPNVLRIFKKGLNDDTGKVILSLVRSDGSDLTVSELSEIRQGIRRYICFADVDAQDRIVGLGFQNVDWKYIDVDFRVAIDSDFDAEDVRIEIQTSMASYLDFRFWNAGQKVEWDDLLGIAKGTPGVDYVSDDNFIPSADIDTLNTELPRIRKFIMRDLSGNVIYSNTVDALDVFYSNFE